MNSPDQRPDEELALAYSQGDVSAGETLARRYVAGLYDFSLRVTLDPAAAEAAIAGALRRVGEELSERPRTLVFSSWVYGLARDEVLTGIRRKTQSQDSEEEPPPTALAIQDARFTALEQYPDPPEAATWAWQAVKGQRPRDYSVLDLLLRRKLTPEETGDIAALSNNGVYAVIGRLRGVFEEAYAATALASVGTGACETLGGIVASNPTPGPATRREISRHIETCPICTSTREGLPSAADVFAALQTVPYPPDTWQRIRAALLVLQPPAADEPAGDVEDAETEAVAPLPSTLGLPPRDEEEDPAQPEADDSALNAEIQAEEGAGEEPEFSMPAVAPSEDVGDRPESPIRDEEPPDFLVPPRPAVASSEPPEEQAETAPFAPVSEAPEEQFDMEDEGPPGLPPEDFEPPPEDDRLRIVMYAALAVVIAFATFLGFALGDSLQNTSNSSGQPAAVLPTPDSSFPDAICGPEPITIPMASSVNLLIPDQQDGFEVTDIAVVPLTEGASLANITTVAQAGQSVAFISHLVPGAAGTIPRYRLIATLTEGDQLIPAECDVLIDGGPATEPPAATATGAVNAPVGTDTPSPDAATPTPTVPAVLPTPTEAPEIATPTETSVPPTPTGTPPTTIFTRTPTPGATSTPTVGPTFTPTTIPTPEP